MTTAIDLVTCCFCLDDITAAQSSISLKCNHVFHSICFRQYTDSLCPLCRADKSVKEEKFGHTGIGTRDPEQYVWIFGSFHNGDGTDRTNYVVVDIGIKQVNGYFWRLFDDTISKKLEKQYALYTEDKTQLKTEIEIGSMIYTILYDKFGAETHLGSDPGIKVCLQISHNMKFRPVLRIKWRDVLDKLLVVGIHDATFFERIYVYCKPDGTRHFFDMANMECLNAAYTGRNGEIVVDGGKYVIDTRNNCLVDERGEKLQIEIYQKQKVVNR